jgi:hypothetical protein
MRFITVSKNEYRPHKWFAWYPVKVMAFESIDGRMKNSWIWLETVRRIKKSRPHYKWFYTPLEQEQED